MMTDFSPETTETQISRTTFFKCEKNYQPRILYPVKYPSGTEIETFSDKEKLSESVSSRHTLKQRLKGHSQKTNGKRRNSETLGRKKKYAKQKYEQI